MSAAGVLVLAVAVLVLVVAACIKVIAWQRKSLRSLSAEVESQRKNMGLLSRHAEKISEIDSDRNGTDVRIGEAGSDDEILGIINAVVRGNNDRVRDGQGGSDRASAEAGSGRDA